MLKEPDTEIRFGHLFYCRCERADGCMQIRNEMRIFLFNRNALTEFKNLTTTGTGKNNLCKVRETRNSENDSSSFTTAISQR